MSLSDIRTHVAENVNRDDVPDTSGGKIDRWINDVQRQICRVYNFPFMETEATSSTVDEQRSYSLPDGSGTDLRFKAEINCELINSENGRVKLTKAHKQDIENKSEYADLDDKGVPRHYAIQNNQIHLYHKPDHSQNNDTAWTINFEYYGYLADLSTDAGTNDLIDDYPEVVEAGATARALKWAGTEGAEAEGKTADSWEREFREMLAIMIREADEFKFGTLEEGMRPQEGSGAWG